MLLGPDLLGPSCYVGKLIKVVSHVVICKITHKQLETECGF